MSEPAWELLGGGGVIGGPIDYVGDWAVGTSYQPGQIVRYQGIDYLAVNPSVGQVPPGSRALTPSYGTSLPTSPVDGQEAILVDSLTNPSYQWRFRYNAGSSSAYKWEFVGGPPAYRSVLTDENILFANSWTNCTTIGPDFVVPRSGDYWGRVHARAYSTSTSHHLYIGVANASLSATPVGMHNIVTLNGGFFGSLALETQLLGFVAAQTARVQYYASDTGCKYAQRVLAIIPVRVA